MNFFYRWCARMSKKHQESIQNEIKEHKRLLEQAMYFAKLCEDAKSVADRWTGVSAPNPMVPAYSKEDIETLVHFVHFKVSGSRVNWRDAARLERDWFIDNGLPIPQYGLNHTDE